MPLVARLLLVVLCLSARALPAAAAPAAATFSVYAPYVGRSDVAHPETRLVFASETVVDDQASSNIFTSNPDGTDRVQLTFETSRGGAQSPIWSPDGTWIAYTRVSSVQGELWVMHADGSHAHALTFPTGAEQFWGAFAWSPHSTHLAVDTTRGIALLPVVGTAPARLVTQPIRIISTLTWSPDGQHLAFDTYPSSVNGTNIYVLTLDGSPPRLVVSGGMWPVWSPDGQRIAYGLAQQLMLMQPDGTEATVLTTTLNVMSTQPQWSPDGRTIAIDSGPNTIAIVSLQGAPTVPITGGCCNNRVLGISWAPDSKRLVFSTAAYQSLASFRARADGTQTARLPPWLALPNWAQHS